LASLYRNEEKKGELENIVAERKIGPVLLPSPEKERAKSRNFSPSRIGREGIKRKSSFLPGEKREKTCDPGTKVGG